MSSANKGQFLQFAAIGSVLPYAQDFGQELPVAGGGSRWKVGPVASTAFCIFAWWTRRKRKQTAAP